MSKLNPLFSSMSENEKEIFELWKEYGPENAFIEGLDEYAGKLFIPTDENIKAIKVKLSTLLKKVDEKNQKKLLQSMDVYLDFEEPFRIMSTGRGAFFGHIVKEGINVQHLSHLAEELRQAITVSKERHLKKEWPTEIKVVTCQACDELKGLLNTIVEETKEPGLKSKIKELIGIIEDYRNAFKVEGVVEGDFAEVFPILEKSGGDLGHKRIYPKILKYMFDFYETPSQIESKALRQLKKELPVFRKAIARLAKIYGCEPTLEAVSKKMLKRAEIPKSKIIEWVTGVRKVLLPVLAKDLVRITPNYDTRVIETPQYLVNFIPTAATSAFNLLTDKPFSVFFLTTDEKRSPPAGAADVLQTIVHEETGHCVHYQNSATGFGAKASPADLMDSSLSYAVSDGISFHRELEWYNLIKKLASEKDESLTDEERRLLEVMRAGRDLNEVVLENEVILRQWRFVRFLRAVFDSRVNMGKQTVTEFVKWGSKVTGLEKKLIYNQTFIFLENVGYAPVYFIVGDAIRQIQEKAVKRGVKLVDFNTYATSIGYGARTLFEEKLKNYGKEKPKARKKQKA